MMDWIEHQPQSLLKHWLQQTRVPLLTSSSDGSVFWCNKAFEEFLGYTISELRDIENCWVKLTVDQHEANHDKQMAESLVKGERFEYSYQKKYVTKTGQTKYTTIHVLRYPLIGDFEFALVSLIPIGDEEQQLLLELQKLEKMIIAITLKPDIWDKVILFCSKRPKSCLIGGLILGWLIFGDPLIESLIRIKDLIFK